MNVNIKHVERLSDELRMKRHVEIVLDLNGKDLELDVTCWFAEELGEFEIREITAKVIINGIRQYFEATWIENVCFDEVKNKYLEELENRKDE